MSILSAPSSEPPGIEFCRLFAIPVLFYYWQDSDVLNARLRRTVLTRLERSPGTVRSNRGGWHSEADLQTWPEECVQVFCERIREAVREVVRRATLEWDDRHLEGWEIEGWANVSAKGAFNIAHEHYIRGRSLWSGFYYVDPGQSNSPQDMGGKTKFQDRSRVPKEILRNPDLFEREVTVIPRAGLMVVFPASLYHYVEPYHGDSPRISLAFNLRHNNFQIPEYRSHPQPSWWWRNFRGLMIVPWTLRLNADVLTKIPGRVLAPRPAGVTLGMHLRRAFRVAREEAMARYHDRYSDEDS